MVKKRKSWGRERGYKPRGMRSGMKDPQFSLPLRVDDVGLFGMRVRNGAASTSKCDGVAFGCVYSVFVQPHGHDVV